MNPKEISMTGYMKLYTQLREKITRRIYHEGDRLPSKRQLADESGYSVITVEHAYELLAEEGYVEPRERSGYYVIYKEGDSYPVGEGKKVRRRLSERVVVERRDEGERDLFPFSAFARTMRNVLSNYGEKILDPSPNKGCVELREALASYLARSRHMEVSPEAILIGSGAEYLYGLNVQVLGRNRVYALENPSYEKIRKGYEASQVPLEMLTMGKEGIETEELQRSRASVLHVTPFNSYPSGITASASKRAEYIRWARARKGYIIEDDFENEFVYLQKPTPSLFGLAGGENVVYIGSFSRLLLPSIRVSFMVLPSSLRELYAPKASFYNQTASKAEQIALCQFIRDGHLVSQTRKLRRLYAQKLKSLSCAVREVFETDCQIKTGAAGTSLALTIPCTVNAKTLKDAARAEGMRLEILKETSSDITLVLSCSSIPVKDFLPACQLLKNISDNCCSFSASSDILS